MKLPFFTSKLRSQADFYMQIVLLIVIVALIVGIVGMLPIRLDVTETRLYSISPVTKQTLHDLNDVITIRAYFTKDLPGYLISVREEVRDMLAEYKNYGKGNIQIRFLNPNEKPELEQEAQSFGIPPLQLNVVRKDKFEVAQGYLGIAVVYGDTVEVIPVVQDTRTLEYDLTLAIKKVVSGEEYSIGIAQKEGAVKSIQEMQRLSQALSRQYTVETVDLASGNLVPDTISTLIVPGPYSDLSERELYVLDQFVMSGKGILFAVDGVLVDNQLSPIPNESNIFTLLQNYGATINKTLVFDQKNFGQAAFSTGGGWQFLTPYGFWPKIPSTAVNEESVLVNQLEGMMFPWVSTITMDEGDGKQVLVRGSSDAVEISGSFDLNPQSMPTSSGKGDKPLAVAITGEVKSIYETSPSKEGIKDQESSVQTENVVTLQKNARIYVVSDVDFLTDGFLARENDANLTFTQNLIDGMTLDPALASIRSKSVNERAIRPLDDTARTLVKYGNIVGVPLVVVVYAVIRFAWRKKSQRVESGV